MDIQLLCGDALEVLKTLPSESVHCIVTSPPYWGLRNYGVDGQLGAETTPEEYVEKIVIIFREARRVLRKDGTLWLNIGDTSAAKRKYQVNDSKWGDVGNHTGMMVPKGCKAKDLIGIPWMVAFALRVDGWYLRSEIIWGKPNAMPESVKDRPTRSHEKIFLFAKSPRYFYDFQAIKEPAQEWSGQAATFKRNSGKVTKTLVPGQAHTQHRPDRKQDQVGNRRYTGFNARWDSQEETPSTRNKRDVWLVSTRPFKGAHFATFNPELITPCVLAGCPEGGIVLDPFSGAGTTGVVAQKYGRNYIGIDLNPEYIQMSADRLGVSL
jgi:DNA modification methylase